MESLENIRTLLERFYQGDSSLEEERQLEEFFASGNVPEEFMADRELFQSFGSLEENIQVPSGLKQQIIEGIDREARREKQGKRLSLYSMSGLAAGILALVAVYLFFLKDNEPVLLAGQEMIDTYEDPLLAYEEARQTLAFVSEKMNMGTSELEHVRKVARSSTEPLKSLSKINSGKQELILLGQLQRVREIDN
jgi:hypothetical protein